jgi:P4 family phage/plasmid primase-like protien
MSSTRKAIKSLEKSVKDTIDGRRRTSPINGSKGGRDFLPVQEWAEDFIRREFWESETYTLRLLGGQWFEYRGDYWHTREAVDIEARIMAYLQHYRGDVCRLSSALRKDLMENLVSTRLCFLDSKDYAIPCFLKDRTSARSWIPMKNKLLNIKLAAQAVADGTSLPADAIRELTPDAFFTYGLPYEFDSTARCPKWEKYLEDVQPEPEARDAMQMLFGLALTPDTSYNVAFFLQGEGGTGKSIILTALAGLVGESNCCCIPMARLADRFGLAPLTQKLLNLVGEMPEARDGTKSADLESVFKAVTAGDLIPVEKKFQDLHAARPIARMVFATNHLPNFSDRSDGVWDRVRIFPFARRFRDTPEQNPHLGAEILEELPGIFNWALRGLVMLWARKTFPETAAGKKMKAEHRNNCDHERAFLTEHVEEHLGGFALKEDLYKAYRTWTIDNGYRPVGAGRFNQAVSRIYPGASEGRRRTEAGRPRVILGIQLKRDF